MPGLKAGSLELWMLESEKGLGEQAWAQSGNNGVPIQNYCFYVYKYINTDRKALDKLSGKLPYHLLTIVYF